MKRTTRLTPHTPHTPGERRAWGWVAHLRAGGTARWDEWRGEGEQTEQGGRILPGAQQLELLRRLNGVGEPSPVLAERILSASAPGRGRPDLELEGAAESSRFGPPPIDPGELPDDELIRVATSLIADDLVSAGVPRNRAPGGVRPWRTRYRIIGDPWLADPIRSELIVRGRPPGGRGSVILVMGTRLDTMLVDAWTSRSFSEGGPSWGAWLGSAVSRRQVPPRVDLVQIAKAWSDRVGPGRVRVVLDPAAVPRLVGVRRALPTSPAIAANGVDLARRVAAVLGLLVVPHRRKELLRETLLPRLVEVDVEADGAGLAVPAEHERWVRRRAVRMRDGLLSAGYAVHGDPDTLVPSESGPASGVTDPSEAGVLALAMRLLLHADDVERGLVT